MRKRKEGVKGERERLEVGRKKRKGNGRWEGKVRNRSWRKRRDGR